MTEVLRDRAPRVRCYECGSDRIFSVCHHCHRPMCEDHSPLVFRQAGVLVRTPNLASEDVRPVSQEFAGLRLAGHREAVFHCTDHTHIVHSVRRWIISGAGVAALGFLLLFAASTLGILLLLVGGVVVGLSLGYRHLTTAPALRPPLPIVPQVNGVKAVERVTGYVRLEDGEYTSTVEAISGELKVDVSANDGHSALLAYRKKYRLPAAEPVEFTGGHLMLEGGVGLAFRPGQSSVLAGGTGISLGGNTDGHELFPPDPELRQRESSFVVHYDVQNGRTPREIPLWIVPSLVPRSDRRSLEIDLHWNRIGPRHERLSLASFELIELEVPVSWGNVESFVPDRVEIGRSGGRRTIRWKQVRPTAADANSLTLQLRFERPITEVRESVDLGDLSSADGGGTRTRLTLAGKVEATFHGLLSGVTGVGVFLPGGGSGHRAPVTTQSKVAVTFDVNLRSIRYQHERVVPDENHAGDVAAGRNRADEFNGVVPDYRIVSDLTSAISADGFYVKSVVEHPPHRDVRRQGVVTRVWDITGRRYLEVFPIDFAVSLRGEQISGGGGSGKTFAQVTVKGAYAMGTLVERREFDAAEPGTAVIEADGLGDELLTRIEDTWTNLHAHVVQILAYRAGRVGGIRALGASEDNLLVGEVITSGTAEVPYDGMTAPSGSGSAGRETELRRQLRAADEAVLADRISAEDHRSIVSRIEAELEALGKRMP
jgi:hypothetical protein